MSEKKSEQLGLRVSPETREQYKEFCDAHKCAQGEGLDLLLQLQRLQEAERENPARAENLAAFRHHMECLFTLQVASITLAEDAKAFAREEFAAQLGQNAQLIQTLQETKISQEQALVDARTAKDTAETELARLRDKVAELEGRLTYAQAQLQDKEHRISALTEEVSRTEGLPARYQDLLETTDALRTENKTPSVQLKDAEIDHMRKIGELERELHNAQLEVAKLHGYVAK